ncbi:hypothetical protein HZA75_06575, partial [Candidatus Roizmanbacteria bacterium]|nr:hypothetical protein [Candidatus Roizmanbacteria bacterium]
MGTVPSFTMKKYILFVLYPIVLLAFSFWSYLYVDWHLELLPFSWYKNLQTILWNFSLNQRVLSAFIYILLVLLLFTFYFILLLLIKNGKLSLKKIIILLLITIGTLFLSHPALSHDIFNYIMTAKIVTFYRENPWVVMPTEFIGEPMLNFLHAGNKIVLYGPVWVAMTLIPSFLGQNIFLLAFSLFKLLIIGFYAGSLWLIYRLNKEQKNPEAMQNLIFFAFNPLVLIETLSSSHNDIVMMFFALLSFYLLMKKNFLFSIIYFLFFVAIKYATIFLLPAYLYSLYQSWKKREVNYDKIFFYSTSLMFLVFFLSPLREELYPWYLIWPLSFLALLKGYRNLKILTIVLSWGLLLRYVPF